MGNATGIARKAGALFALISGLGIGVAQASCPAPDKLKATSFERHFIQEKHVSGLNKPLRSEGQMSVSEKEIVWHMSKPFDVKTTMSSTGITQSVDGGEPVSVGPESSDIAGGIAKSMASMMRGEWSTLEKIFVVDASPVPAEGDWVVRLTPHDERLGALIGKITIHGCTDVNQVNIERPDGDGETIRFDPVKL
ncbi:MAG: outer membrane lipoprotein carrier protein LolA [Parvibaculum sp.]|nr:outer membrane lipoprotein carrier protein LolA [Parvibaculum sp.]